MVLVELAVGWNLMQIWLLIVGLGWLLIMSTSSTCFYFLFYKPTYQKWRHKSSPLYPKPVKVREEIMQMNKGLIFSAFPPALTVWFVRRGWTKSYTGVPDSWLHELGAQFIFLIILDFLEFLYHYYAHRLSTIWQFHKFHHTFPNPSPFAVIADEFVDQLVRASPMLVIPFFLRLNVDLMFAQMALLIYGYGTYLHCGHEFDYPDAHHSLLNTSYHHYCHHAVSIINKPYHCGFAINIWDRIFGSVYPRSKCFCAKCCQAKGERSLDKWNNVVKPDYSVLLTWPFWKEGFLVEWRKLINGELIRFR